MVIMAFFGHATVKHQQVGKQKKHCHNGKICGLWVKLTPSEQSTAWTEMRIQHPNPSGGEDHQEEEPYHQPQAAPPPPSPAHDHQEAETQQQPATATQLHQQEAEPQQEMEPQPAAVLPLTPATPRVQGSLLGWLVKKP